MASFLSWFGVVFLTPTLPEVGGHFKFQLNLGHPQAALTIHLEESVPKQRLLEIYLNVVEFGIGIYGAEAAARHYFNKPASALSEREAALLAASLPRPKSWHPGVDDNGYLGRASRIQTWMAQARYLNRYL